MSMKIPYTPTILLEPAIYDAEVKNVQVCQGRWGQQLKLAFSISNVEEATTFIFGWCNAVLTDRSKLGRWTKALLGIAEFPDLYLLDIEGFKGKKCRVEIEDREGIEGPYNVVANVLPVKELSRVRRTLHGPVLTEAPNTDVAPQLTEPEIAASEDIGQI